MPMGKFVPSVGWNVDTNLNVVVDRKENEEGTRETQSARRVRRNVGKERKAKLGMRRFAKAEASSSGGEVAPEKKDAEIVVAVPSVQPVTVAKVLNRENVGAPSVVHDPISVTMFLYAPPTWELTHLAAPMTLLSPLAVADLRRIADLHFKHLTFVASVLEMCLEHANASSEGGSPSPQEWIQVKELHGGLVEITVVWRRGKRNFRELVERLGAGEEAYTIEVMTPSDQNDASDRSQTTNTEAASLMSSPASQRQEVESFLAFVETLVKEDRPFGGGRSQLL